MRKGKRKENIKNGIDFKEHKEFLYISQVASI